MGGLTALQLIVGLIATALFGFSKTGIPTTGALGAGLLASVLPALPSTGIALPALLVGDLIAVTIFRRNVRIDLILRLLPSVVIGVALGFLVMRNLSQHTGSIILGVILLIGALGEVLRRRGSRMLAVPEKRHSKLSQLLGVSAGVSTMIANAGGPFMTLYLLRLRIPSRALMGTMAWFFFTLNLLKVPFSVHLGLINSQSLVQSLMLVPGILIGTFAGYRLLGRISTPTFEMLALIGTAITGVWLLR